MAITRNDKIDDADLIPKFDNTVRLVIQGITVWYSGLAMPELFPTGNLGPLVQPAPSTGLLTADRSLVVANLITKTFGDYTKEYTSVRLCRYILTVTGPSGGTSYDQTQIASLTDINYDQPAMDSTIDSRPATYKILKEEGINATNLNNYVAQLYTDWNTAKNNTVTFTSSKCHGNCHGSCHAARRHR